jgi:hypothetical protein
MHLALWVLVATLGSEPERAPALDDLIGRLGAARYAERQEAAAAIEAIGGPALPALRDAARADDPEVRSRAEWLVGRVETIEMARPWRVRLDFRDRPLDAIVAEAEAQWPCRLAWAPRVPDERRRRRVTLRSDGPLPFWAAVDGLCAAGDLHVVPGSPGGEGDGRPPQFRLFLAPGREASPHADEGPLRLEVESVSEDRASGFGGFDGLNRNRGGRFAPAPARPPRGDRQGRAGWRVRLRLLAEPRLLIDRHGQVEVHEAIDEKGQSLLPPGGGPHLGYSGSDFVPAQAAISIGLGMPLSRPEAPGTRIARLRVTVPVAVLARRPDPLVVPLVGSVGHTFRTGKTTLIPLGTTRDNQGHASVAFRIRSEAYVPVNLGQDGVEAWRPVRPEVTPNFVQVFDDRGRQFPWIGGVQEDDDGDAPDATAKLTLWPEGGLPVPEATARPVVPPEAKATAVPAELHLYEPARTVIRATFTLTDIPLPAPPG